jgi:RNA polymerase sigma-70 factor (ECF subfamily)
MSDDIQAMVGEIPALRRYGRALSGNRSSADDLVQDTLERAIQKFHLYEPGTKLRLWLFTIMRNIFLDHYRKHKKMATITVELSGMNPDYRVPDQIDKLVHKDLLQQLSSLKTEYKELLMLVGVEGLSYEQAAALTGVPLGTVRSRLFRARNMLLKKVEGEDVVRRRSNRRPSRVETIEVPPLVEGRDEEIELVAGQIDTPPIDAGEARPSA